jgi:DNA invertase Pin-like site-specific DNA recombinase
MGCRMRRAQHRLERSLITERTRAGVKAAQRRGVKCGRKPKLTPDRLTHAQELIEQSKTPTQAAKIMAVKPRHPLPCFAA